MLVAMVNAHQALVVAELAEAKAAQEQAQNSKNAVTDQ